MKTTDLNNTEDSSHIKALPRSLPEDTVTGPPVQQDLGVLALLTVREQQVVRLILIGESNKGIARILNISVATVKSHVHNLLVKLGVERRGRLALQMSTSQMVDHTASSLSLLRVRTNIEVANPDTARTSL